MTATFEAWNDEGMAPNRGEMEKQVANYRLLGKTQTLCLFFHLHQNEWAR